MVILAQSRFELEASESLSFSGLPIAYRTWYLLVRPRALSVMV